MHLYSGPVSLFSRKVEIALHEKGLTFTREMVPFTQSGGYNPKHPAVLAANPKGQVPVLVDGGLTLTDSTIILEYLEDAYPDPPLLPPDPAGRARCRQWELFADEIMLAPLRTLMFRTEPPVDTARRARQEEEAARNLPLLAAHLATLDAALDGRACLCGDTPTIADIGAYVDVLYAHRLQAPPAGLANLDAWYARLAERPAFAKVTAEIAEADRALSYPWVG